MEDSRELRERMKIHIKLMVEQYSGHEFDHLTGRCRCGASIGLWRHVRAIRETDLEEGRLGDAMRPCKYSEV